MPIAQIDSSDALASDKARGRSFCFQETKKAKLYAEYRVELDFKDKISRQSHLMNIQDDLRGNLEIKKKISFAQRSHAFEPSEAA